LLFIDFREFLAGILGAFFIARIYATFVAASFYLKMFTFMTFLARPDPPVPPILTRPLAIQCQRQQQPRE